jgi:hypothetical protein
MFNKFNKFNNSSISSIVQQFKNSSISLACAHLRWLAGATWSPRTPAGGAPWHPQSTECRLRGWASRAPPRGSLARWTVTKSTQSQPNVNTKSTQSQHKVNTKSTQSTECRLRGSAGQGPPRGSLARLVCHKVNTKSTQSQPKVNTKSTQSQHIVNTKSRQS